MPISSHIDQEKDIATFTADGDLTLDEIMAIALMLYDQPTKDVLFDLTAASTPDFSINDIMQIASLKQRSESPGRIDGKTAIVAKKDLAYGLSRMFQSLSEMNRVPFEVSVFRTIEEAKEWLEV